jgi:hypothetical protein
MNSKKQEQKHEQILRGLLALPENKKCADCTAKVLFFLKAEGEAP